MSLTGRLHAVVAFKAWASSSTMPQFSGPFNPRPAETTRTFYTRYGDLFARSCLIVAALLALVMLLFRLAGARQGQLTGVWNRKAGEAASPAGPSGPRGGEEGG